MQDAIHPFNVTYKNLYDYLNCLKISPCWGWLNSDETIRNAASEHAMMLNGVYKDLVKSGIKFKNFDFDFYEIPIDEFI